MEVGSAVAGRETKVCQNVKKKPKQPNMKSVLAQNEAAVTYTREQYSI